MTRYFCDQCKGEFEYAGLRRVQVKVIERGLNATRDFDFEVCVGCYKAFLRDFDKTTKKIKGPQDAPPSAGNDSEAGN